MDDNKIYEFILSIKEKLSSIDTKVDAIRDTLKNHEHRLQTLEKAEPSSKDSCLKDKMIEFSMKAMIGLIAVVIALTSAGGILTKLMQ